MRSISGLCAVRGKNRTALQDFHVPDALKSPKERSFGLNKIDVQKHSEKNAKNTKILSHHPSFIQTLLSVPVSHRICLAARGL